VIDSAVFLLVDILIHCGDIRDQSPKLSEIASNFRRFWPSQVLGAQAPRSGTKFSCVLRDTFGGKVS